MSVDIELYKELITFCNNNQETIETKFKRELSFSEFNATCYIEMFEKCRRIENPLPVKYFKEIIPELTEAYKKYGLHFIKKRNESIKGLDIQKGQWYEKALQFFLNSKGFSVIKKGFPYPDFEVRYNDKIVGYYELKYIKAPFLSANVKIKNTTSTAAAVRLIFTNMPNCSDTGAFLFCCFAVRLVSTQPTP